MNDVRINAALHDVTDTRDVTIGPGALASAGDLFEQSFGGQPAVIVADENTFAIAGEEVWWSLEKAGCELIEPHICPGWPTLYAKYAKIEKLLESLHTHDAIPVAIGSGTLNNIAKRAAYECDRLYLCVGTVASMDEYTAFGASIEKDGYKQTLTCPAPRAVLADVNVLVNAPDRMTASGYADL